MQTKKLVPFSVLSTLTPVCYLGEDEIDALSEKTYLEAIPKGEHIFRAGFSDPWAYYLLSGEVLLVSDKDEDKMINAEMSEAKKPLAQEKPRKVSAKAKTDVIFIKIPEEALAEVLTEGSTDGSTDEALIEKKVLKDINHLLKQNKLEIPSLPDIALQVREAVQTPDIDIETIAKIIQNDPALTARIIQVANSPIYRGASTITGCHMAVSRMGIQITRDLVTGCTLQNLFESDSATLKKMMTDLWSHSTYVAALSAVIARLSHKVDEDHAMLAGLMHNIGSLPILSYAEHHTALKSDTEMLARIIEEVSGKIGAIILEHWQFDKEFITVAKEAHNWERDSGPQVDYCDIVILAQLYSFIDTPQMETHPAINEVPAFAKLPFGKLGPKMTLKVLETAKNDIKEIQSMLHG